MMQRRLVTIVLGLGVLAGPAAAVEFNDKAVEDAIQRGIQFLWSVQKPNGSWEIFGKDPKSHNYHYSGPTALACYALLESGVNPQDPRLRKALLWLADYSKKENGTYSLGLRCNVWEAAERHQPGKYKTLLREEARRLWYFGKDGRYWYKTPPLDSKTSKNWDNSNCQYGVLGVWAAAQAGMEVPAGYWEAVRRHWEGCQLPDGGWGYNKSGRESTSAMTTGGVATLFVAYDALYYSKFINCGAAKDYYPRAKRGLDWLDKNFDATLKNQKMGHSDLFYYLYGVERVGLASGYKYFGSHDWYKTGAQHLLNSQRGGKWQGKWGPTVGTSFALVFLIRGRNPVIVNKLEFDGDWNNRPRDMANLTSWMSRIFERRVNWQIINLKAPVAEWHDAPILYLSASRTPKFSETELNNLRTFVQQGGAIFSASECGGAGGYRKGIREVFKKLFPQYELKECPKGHDIYTRKVHFDLPGRPKLYVMSNGARPLIVHTDEDLPLQWQVRRTVTQGWAFQAAVNVIRYITDRVSSIRPRGTTHWPKPGGATTRTVKLARLKHSGDYDPEPLAYVRFSRLMAQRTKVGVEVVGPLAITDLAASGARVATLTGTKPLHLTPAETAALKDWVEKDKGTLVIDAAGGSREFYNSADKMLKQVFGVFKVRRMSTTAPVLLKQGYEIRQVKYRRRTKARLGSDAPNLKGVFFGTRAGVLLSREDITCGLVGFPSWTVDGYEPESAFEIMRNAVLSAEK